MKLRRAFPPGTDREAAAVDNRLRDCRKVANIRELLLEWSGKQASVASKAAMLSWELASGWLTIHWQ